jgi:hypothetical protein
MQLTKLQTKTTTEATVFRLKISTLLTKERIQELFQVGTVTIFQAIKRHKFIKQFKLENSHSNYFCLAQWKYKWVKEKPQLHSTNNTGITRMELSELI